MITDGFYDYIHAIAVMAIQEQCPLGRNKKKLACSVESSINMQGSIGNTLGSNY